MEEQKGEIEQLEDLKTKEVSQIEELNPGEEFIEEKIEEKNENELEKTDNLVENKEQVDKNQKNNATKKGLIIILLLIILVIGVVLFFFVKNDKEEKKKKVEMDYNSAMLEYGDSIIEEINLYRKRNEEVPSLDILMEQKLIEGYEIKCEVSELYEDYTIYLDKCSINNSKTLYSYGEPYGLAESPDDIMKDFGNKKLEAIENYIKTYKKEPTKVPEITYDSHKVSCKKEYYYDSSNIYLGECSIDGSDPIYSFGALQENGKIIIKEEAYCEDKGTWCEKEFVIQCENNDCKLYDKVSPYAIINEGNYHYRVLDYIENQLVYDSTSNIKITNIAFVAKEGDIGGERSVIGLILKNSVNQEAFYNLSKRKMIFNYGKYKYVWKLGASESDSEEFDLDLKKSFVTENSDLLKFVANNKMGLANINTGEVLISPNYDDIEINYDHIYVLLNGKKGVFSYDNENISTKLVIEPKIYDNLIYNSYQRFNSEQYGENASLFVYQNQKAGLYNYNIKSKSLSLLVPLGVYDDLEDNYDYLATYKNKMQGIMKYEKKDGKFVTLLEPKEYDYAELDGDFIYARKNGNFYLLDANSGKVLLNGKSYKAIAAINYAGGRAMVYDGNNLQILDLNGNLIKKLTEIDSNIYQLHTRENCNSTNTYDNSYEVGSYNYGDSINTYISFEKKGAPSYDYSACSQYTYNYLTNELTTEDCALGYGKPVLYLYPVLPTLVNVTFQYPNRLTTTYPKYKAGWTVFASPNGDLRDLNNKYYYGLYWEETLNHRVDFKEGFYVTKDNAIDFLEEKLSIIGLNDRERNEFIMYWLPILERNEKNLVYFELTEERNLYSPINISPKPNSMLRVAIHVKKVEKEVKIKEQKLSTFERTGFTAVEWGGVTY